MIALIALLAVSMFPTAGPSPLASSSASVPAEPGEADLDVIGGFDIRSTSIDYNYSNGDYTIPSRFTATNSGTDITADHARGNSKRKVIVADGNVVIHQNRGPKPSILTCDHIDADGKTRLYTVTGHVRFTQGTRDVTADRGTFNDKVNEVHMEGHVVIRDQGQTLNANAVDYNTLTGDGRASGNVMVISPLITPPPGTPGPKRRGGHG